jgi:hypothetical protein
MAEIYWITRLDCVQGFFIAFLILTGFVIVMATITFLRDDAYDEETPKAKRVLKWAVPSFAIALLVLCFIPSTKEGILMYGLGSTIDYIKSNDKAKQLPDKCIDALTRYVDSIEKENKDNNNN